MMILQLARTKALARLHEMFTDATPESMPETYRFLVLTMLREAYDEAEEALRQEVMGRRDHEWHLTVRPQEPAHAQEDREGG